MSASNETTVPKLSASEIETLAEEILAQQAAAVLRRPTRTPILELIERAMEEDGLLFDASQDLGSTKDGRKILGIFQQDPLAIRIDASLASEDGKFRFTAAHEFGHFTLHRELSIGSDIGLERTIQDTSTDFEKGRRSLSSPRDWIEWQANHFAAAVLIPRLTIKRAVHTVQQRIGITSNRGRIILEHKGYSYQDLNRQLAELSLTYIVSRTAMQNRLETLGILVDRRNKNISSFRNVLGDW